MTRFRTVLVLVAGVALLVHPISAQKKVEAADVLRVTADYVASYAKRISGVSMEENYLLLNVSGSTLADTSRIASDVVFVDLNGEILALRDAFSLDTNRLRERTPRIITLLSKPSQATFDEAQTYAAESFRYFQDEIIMRLNAPTLALCFVAEGNQPKITYKIDGSKRLDGVEVVGLRFEENKRFEEDKKTEGDYIVQTPGKARATGRLWVEPASGCVHRTELSMQSKSESARIEVDYARDAALDLWLPSVMNEKYQVTEVTGGNIHTPGTLDRGLNVAQGSRAFDSHVRYTNASLTPIDLTISKPPK
jgi:hypothetical protein